MMETVMIVAVVVTLALLSALALRGRRDLREIRQTLAEAQVTPERLLETFNDHLATLRHLSSLFRDDDYHWLRQELGLSAAARTLKHRRIRLARAYLRLMLEDFNRLSTIHHVLASEATAQDSRDQVAAMTLRVKFRIYLACLLLPLNYVRLNLSPLADLSRTFNALALRLTGQLEHTNR
ncbi:MAG: hypothetical protein JXQ27_17130 [Acidobacteria bacterium]|nr:hypothetical protein [Acidobacteriota bacterium]